jgi:hypothetical protein
MSFGGVDEKKLVAELCEQALPDAEVRIRRIIADLATRPLHIKGTIGGVQMDATFQLGDKA